MERSNWVTVGLVSVNLGLAFRIQAGRDGTVRIFFMNGMEQSFSGDGASALMAYLSSFSADVMGDRDPGRVDAAREEPEPGDEDLLSGLT